jgi:hypothetical protein
MERGGSMSKTGAWALDHQEKETEQVYNCVACDKKVQFENSDDTFEEYEVDEEGNKYCSSCYGENNDN